MRSSAAAAVVIAGLSLQPQRPAISVFLDAGSADARRSERALAKIGETWRDADASLLIDVARFLPRERPSTGETIGEDGTTLSEQASSSPAARTRTRIIRFLERRAGKRFGDDLGRWREWMWQLPYEPHPEYAALKRELYGRVDPRMRNFFPAGVATRIRLDEIDWGGVGVNGIPPLDQPRAIPAADAGYLKDTHIVFGIVVNGEARAYPRRILAWHELARDQLGGVDLTIVYCTLCGTVIPYGSDVGGRKLKFGTSGLLYRSNKLMFDEQTATLWSTLDGEPAVGPLVGSSLRLQARPVVTTTWGEWRRTHPGTTVLSLETGHERDYGEGAAYRDYFATDRLMFRVPRTDRRLANKDEVLGLFVPAQGGGRQAAAFDIRLLQRRRVFQAEIEGRHFAVITSANGANRVYETGRVRLTTEIGTNRVADSDGGRWTVTEDALISEAGGTALARVTAFRAFWFGWYAQFPETLLFR